MAFDSSYQDLKGGLPVAQGDVLIIFRPGKPPEEFAPVEAEGGELIVAHSETGHHHVAMPYQPPAGLLAAGAVKFLRSPTLGERVTIAIPEVPLEVRHLRGYDTHPSVYIPPVSEMLTEGYFEFRRQIIPDPKGSATIVNSD